MSTMDDMWGIWSMNNDKKSDSIQDEVDRNYESFLKLLPDIPQSKVGKFAVLRGGKIVEYFDTAGDAATFGNDKFKNKPFSVQQVEERVVDLGYFSHAMHDASI